MPTEKNTPTSDYKNVLSQTSGIAFSGGKITVPDMLTG